MLGLPIRSRAAYVSREFYDMFVEKQEEVKNIKHLLFSTFKSLYGRTWAFAVILYVIHRCRYPFNPAQVHLFTIVFHW